jgi:hypothetical protein
LAVDIEIFGQLLPGQPRCREMEIHEPVTAREVSDAIGLDESEIELVIIDGIQSGLDDLLHPDSRICFFPYITGG